MMPPQQPNVPYADYPVLPDEPHGPRVAVWDVICTVAVWVVLVILAVTAAWLSSLPGFAADMCRTDNCPPLGLDDLFYPVTRGGTVAAFVVAVIGPFVSLRRRHSMFIWPVLAVGILIVSYVAGYAMTVVGQG